MSMSCSISSRFKWGTLYVVQPNSTSIVRGMQCSVMPLHQGRSLDAALVGVKSAHVAERPSSDVARPVIHDFHVEFGNGKIGGLAVEREFRTGHAVDDKRFEQPGLRVPATEHPGKIGRRAKKLIGDRDLLAGRQRVEIVEQHRSAGVARREGVEPRRRGRGVLTDSGGSARFGARPANMVATAMNL